MARLTTYIIDHHSEFRGDKTRPMVLICPGGGYTHLSSREAEPIALRMNAHGYNACILYYSLAPDKYPSQLIEAAMAVDYIKKHAEEWHVNTDKICICGFSADYRPSCMLLAYPVITAGEFAHRGSFDALVGGDEKMYDTVSLEKRVNDDTVPTFIWHTFEDGAVPVENSLLMAGALRKYKIPCELHIFAKGCHGLAGREIQPECACWPELFATWFDNMAI